MQHQFTDAVRTALGTGRKEAIRLGHDHVAPGHLLLGLLAMAAPGLDASSRARARERIEGTLGPGRVSYGPGSKGRGLPFTSSAKKALESALAETRARGDSTVEIEHLFLGVLDADPRLATTLEGCGLTPVTFIDGMKAATHLELAALVVGTEPDVWFLELTPDSETPLYEQIIRAVEEAVATGKLAEGERLPTVRQLAAELEIAPGTVARAYQALEEKGVVVTEGARGTRVAPRDHRSSPGDERASALEGLFRSAVVAAYHMGAKAKEVHQALDRAMKGIYGIFA